MFGVIHAHVFVFWESISEKKTHKTNMPVFINYKVMASNEDEKGNS